MEPIDNIKFGAVDYIFFVIVFVLSMGIGLYYAIKSKREVSTVDDYLLGGRNMGILPVCCSLIATVLSGTTMIGIPAEVYAYGTYIYLMIVVGNVGVFVSRYFLFFEIFHELNLTSTFKYLELRFCQNVRLLASGIYLLDGLLVLPLTVYIPALTFQRVTGVDVYITVVVLSLLCASYTSMGGFKAVVWTDVVQLFLTFASGIVILVVGIQSVGGFGSVYDAADRGGRLYFANTDTFNSRTSLLPMIISFPLSLISQFGVNQTFLQRYLSLSSVRKMKITQWFTIIPYVLVCVFTFLLGLVIYANYETCDPTGAGLIRKMDQIVPHFIMEKATLFQGFSGIFIAGIFSVSLSTTSSYLNAMSGILYVDIISLRYRNLSNKKANNIMKITVILLALFQIAFVFVIEKMGMIIQITAQCAALQGAAMITLFGLGMLVPKANSKGAITGALSAVSVLLILIIGSLNKKPERPLPLRTDGCEPGLIFSNSSQVLQIKTDDDDTFWLFRLNFTYYAFVGTVIGISVGYFTSLATGGNTIRNQKFIAKFLRVTETQEAEEEMRLQARIEPETVNTTD
ncbi:hypothetical protein DMENIID0001_084470 [Sergentomyia squamirostris]